MKRFSTLFFALLFICVFFLSCDGDDPVAEQYSTATYEGTININPNNFPAGGALNLTLGDTGKVAQLDVDASFDWDIKIMTYRTSQGGRPAIFLFGDVETGNAVKALNVSSSDDIALGLAGFNAFATVTTTMQQALEADGVFNFDPAVDIDGSGKPDLAKLETAYTALIIGDKIVNLDEAQQPVFLVKSKSGAFFKFQMIKRENGGETQLRWARFASGSVE